MEVDKDTLTKMVREALSSYQASFDTRAVNDEDEIGMASAYKINAKEQIVDEGESRKRGRSFFDLILSDAITLNKMLISTAGQLMNNAVVADKNLVHQSNVTNKQLLLDAEVAADESMVTDGERLVEMVVTEVLKKLEQ